MDAHRRLVLPAHWQLIVFCSLGLLLVACAGSSSPPSSPGSHHQVLPTNNGTITYSTSSNDVLIRTFYGGGNLGALEFSPNVSIYGDGSYILGPGLQMRGGSLDSTALNSLLHTLVDNDGLLNLGRQQFYDLPDQNATLLQLMLNGKSYTFLYGPFGYVQESAQDMNDYHRLGNALSGITQALSGPLHPYKGAAQALLVHQNFSPDLTQNYPSWTLKDFTLDQLATYECGPTPPDETGPNADTGCLTFTVPRAALLLTPGQLHTIMTQMNGQQQGIFIEQGLYYTVIIRSLLPDELPAQTLAMFGSQELNYAPVPLHQGPVPLVTPTP